MTESRVLALPDWQQAHQPPEKGAVLVSNSYIWDGTRLIDQDTGEAFGAVSAGRTDGGTSFAFVYTTTRSRLVKVGSLSECQLALEKRFREAHQ